MLSALAPPTQIICALCLMPLRTSSSRTTSVPATFRPHNSLIGFNSTAKGEEL
jgi:hypothetical protein